MKKFLVLSLCLSFFIHADVDLGDDFQPGDVITSDAFNNKFGALNSVVGEIVDADLLGTWTCTAYKFRLIDDSDPAFEVGGGGDGRVDSLSLFKSRTGDLFFTEGLAGDVDTGPSLNRPKVWTMTTPDVLFNHPDTIGSYALLANKLYFGGQNGNYLGVFYVHRLSASKFTLVHVPQPTTNQAIAAGPGVGNHDIVCTAVVQEESTTE